MTLFDAAPMTWNQRDALAHAEWWDECAREQPNTMRGRAFAAEAREAAERLREESRCTIESSEAL